MKEIYKILAQENIQLVARHVTSEQNISDPLSRGDVRAFLQRFPAARTQAKMSLPPHLEPLLRPW
ncbi:hypothetical protein M422DRAFT_26588 [Sphaerobolus stellatus SS14]|nr:hypothetical protein M422DRAFT_26588 [Sphaerobolus stellatus SS14]